MRILKMIKNIPLRGRSRVSLLIALAAAVLVSGIILVNNQQNQTAASVKENELRLALESLTPDELTESERSDKKIRKQLLGTWERHDDGRRELTIHDDGTATIDAEIESTSRQWVVGKKVRFDINWTLKNGTLVFETTGGHPSSSVSIITGIYGDTRTYGMEECNDEKFVLRHDDDTFSTWTRVTEE